MFLVRVAFWICVVILFMPTEKDSAPGGIGEVNVSAIEALVAARETVGDLSGFCERNPSTCETGSAALHVFGQKARHGAQMVYGYISEDQDGAGHADADLGSDAIGTLLAEDLAEPWRGPDGNG